MAESDFSKNLKSLSKTSLKIIILGAGLKTKYERILWKYYIEDKSYEEIAEDLFLEYTSVGKLLWRARNDLQRILKTEQNVIPWEVRQNLELLLTKK